MWLFFQSQTNTFVFLYMLNKVWNIKPYVLWVRHKNVDFNIEIEKLRQQAEATQAENP